MDVQYLLGLVVAFLTSWQVKTLLGLIVLDVLLGVATSLKQRVFDFSKLAQFYASNVLPYIVGYLAFYVTVGFVIPPESLGDLGTPVNEATVTLAWGVLVATLLKSIMGNFQGLYQSEDT